MHGPLNGKDLTYVALKTLKRYRQHGLLYLTDSLSN